MDSFTTRSNKLLNAIANKTLKNYPKNDLPICCARLLLKNGNDKDALEYISKSFSFINKNYGDEGDPFFIWIGIIQCLCTWKDKFTEEQIIAIQKAVISFSRWFKGDIDIYPHHDNPVTGGTENHRLMTWSSLYLFTQEFPEINFILSSESNASISAIRVKEYIKNKILLIGKDVFTRGNNEFLSPVYEIFHFIPLLNLYNYAQDSEVVSIVNALLLFHSLNLRLNLHDGYIVAPVCREYGQQQKRIPSISSVLSYLYWNEPCLNDVELSQAHFGVYVVNSKWNLPDWLYCLASDMAKPYEIYQKIPFFKQEHGTYMYRYVYQDTHFAIGSGNTRNQPGTYCIDDTQMSIAITSSKNVNSILCYHPYYYSKDGENRLKGGLCSPFMQIAHKEKSMVVMFEFPEKDPWREDGWNKRWLDQRLENLIHTSICRIPNDFRVDNLNNWTIVNENDVYVAIFPFGGKCENEIVENFYLLKNKGNNSGFIFEVAYCQEAVDVQCFFEKLNTTKFVYNSESGYVSYESCDNNLLEIKYNRSLIPPDNSLPKVSVNKSAINFKSWPLLESKFVSLTDKVLKVEIEKNIMIIDWNDRLPMFTSQK